jgi:hypothetical protein
MIAVSSARMAVGGAMAGRKALWARPACDPDLPERLRLLISEPGLARGPARLLQQRELSRQLDRVIYPHDLHQADRLILARAQVAIAIILDSGVRAAGLLEADEPALRRHEWEIACAARHLTKVRALPSADPAAGVMTAAVLDAQQRALARAEESTASRVSALERYADQVTAADEAHRDWQSALRLAGLNEEYRDLVARTATDELAMTELGDLADRAAITVQVLSDCLQDASLAAEVLALPPAEAG